MLLVAQRAPRPTPVRSQTGLRRDPVAVAQGSRRRSRCHLAATSSDRCSSALLSSPARPPRSADLGVALYCSGTTSYRPCRPARQRPGHARVAPARRPARRSAVSGRPPAQRGRRPPIPAGTDWTRPDHFRSKAGRLADADLGAQLGTQLGVVPPAHGTGACEPVDPTFSGARPATTAAGPHRRAATTSAGVSVRRAHQFETGPDPAPRRSTQCGTARQIRRCMDPAIIEPTAAASTADRSSHGASERTAPTGSRRPGPGHARRAWLKRLVIGGASREPARPPLDAPVSGAAHRRECQDPGPASSSGAME